MRFRFLAPLAVLTLASSALAAPPAPSGAHPRIFLGASTLAAIKAKMGDPASSAARAIAFCDDIAKNPSKYATNDNWQWPGGAPTCGLAWRLTGDPKHAAAGLSMLNALLDDKDKVGDKAGGDKVVQPDDGYFMRVYAPYAALAYDWLWDAPGMDATKRTHARARFKAWVDWYDASGYLRDVPGSNYQAGYMYAKTLIAIAEGGEDGATSDAYWSSVVDVRWTQQTVGQGFSPSGPLVGGDWPEGWQYAPLSTLEYVLGARALGEQGVALPALAQFASDMVVRYRHSMVPKGDMQWVGSGDFDDNDNLHSPLVSRPLLAVMAGPSSDEAAGYAAFLNQTAATEKDVFPFLHALAEARGATPVDYTLASPKWTVVKGTRTVFARSSWDASAFWGVFAAAPAFGPDHQHPDASNVAFSRGSDHLIVDPSPYGSLSTLTSNALSVESNSVGKTLKPSQSFDKSRAELAFARSTASGIVAARADLSQAFVGDGVPSDVPYARRDWAFLPDGAIVLVDRARTDDPSRGMLMRLRSPSDFALDATGAKATVGGSVVDVRAVLLPAGVKATTRHVPKDTNGCYASPTFGVCDHARVDVGEYAIKVPGPSAQAIHVVSGLAAGETAPEVVSMNDAAIDPAKNAAVIGASVHRGTTHTFVVASSAKDGASGASLSYVVPAGGSSHHVVFDAPEDASGNATVTATASGGHCTITITAGGSTLGRPVIFALGDGTDPCKTIDDAPNLPGGTPSGTGGGPGTGTGGSGTGAGGATTGAGGGAAKGGASSGIGGASAKGGASSGVGGASAKGGASVGGAGANAAAADDGSSGGCGCRTAGSPTSMGAAGLVAIAALVARRRRRRVALAVTPGRRLDSRSATADRESAMSLRPWLLVTSCIVSGCGAAPEPRVATPPPAEQTTAAVTPPARPSRFEVRGPEASKIGIDHLGTYPAPGQRLPRAISFSPDGKQVTFLHGEERSRVLSLVSMDVETGATTVLVRGADFAEKKRSREEELRRERQRQMAEGVTEYRWAKKADAMVLPARGDVFLRTNGALTRLTETPEPELDPRLCDDGSRVAYVRGAELFAMDVKTRKEHALTRGVAGTTRGQSDYNGQEEFGERSGYAWAPGCDRIAFVEVDERKVGEVPVMGYREGKADLMMQRYPLTGATNPSVRAGVVDVTTRKTTWITLPPGGERYMGRFTFSPDGKTLYVQTITRDQKQLALVAVDPATGKARELFTELSETWLEFATMRPLESGQRLLWTHAVAGHRHLAVRDAATGAQIADLTSGDGNVDDVVDEDGKSAWFVGAFDGALERHLYSVPLAGGALTRLTREHGTHHAVVSPRHGRFVDLHSATDRPWAAPIRDASGTVTASLPIDVDPEYSSFDARPIELVTVPGPGGLPLFGALLRPRDVKAGERHPVIVMVYGGPHSHDVGDWHAPRLLWQHLADRGFVVFQLDNRGSNGRGPGFEAPIHRRMGQVELEDQLAGVEWLKKQSFVDGERVGIHGHSYGGFMTVLAMLKAPSVFKVGVAGSPVTDFSLYDSGYTERYMGTPHDNPEGYAGTDLTKLAGNLQGKLMLVHALMDENVHFDNTARLVDALVQSRKRFDMFVFPGERHGYRGPAARRYAMEGVVDYFVKNL
jgi:dipeptidyl-peptidase-4